MKQIYSIFNKYFIQGLEIIILGFIFACLFPIIPFKDNEISIILTFIGILATFVVIGNYAQVKYIETKFNKKAEDIDFSISKIEKIVNEVDEIKKQIYGDIANSIIDNSYNIEKEINKDTAFYFVLHAIILLLKNNIDNSFDYYVGIELINRFGGNQQINENKQKEILDAISNTKIKTECVGKLKEYISKLKTDKNTQ